MAFDRQKQGELMRPVSCLGLRQFGREGPAASQATGWAGPHGRPGAG